MCHIPVQAIGIKRVSNPPNPWAGAQIEYLDEPPEIELQVFEERAKSIISRNDSPDIGFSFSINPYRGCFHGCAYCYARPTHQYLDFGAGTDFERKLIVKVNAPELLAEAFERASWKGDLLAFSGVTDCYQPLEASYTITRRCLEQCLRYRNPVSIITKGALIRRDIELLRELHEVSGVQLFISLAFSDDDDSRAIEPYAPRPSLRFRAIRELTSAGLPVCVGVAPVIPGLNDAQMPQVLERAKECGASGAFMTLLRLPAEVQTVFRERLEHAFPRRAAKVLHQLAAMKSGKLNRSDFGERMRGDGEQWKAVRWLFESTCDRVGLNRRDITPPLRTNTFQRPRAQLSLFT